MPGSGRIPKEHGPAILHIAMEAGRTARLSAWHVGGHTDPPNPFLLTTERGVLPWKKSTTLRAVSRRNWTIDSADQLDVCGVISTLSSWRNGSSAAGAPVP